MHIFAWKLIVDMLPKRGKLRHLDMDIYGELPFCDKVEETIDHVSITCNLAVNV